jgi:N-acetylglucosamine malate deacetylase 1
MNKYKTDLLAIGIHPDDVELSAAGTISKLTKEGKTVAIVDLSAGEMGTRGSAALRLQEAKKAQEVMQVAFRENLAMEDCFFEQDKQNTLKIISAIRKYQPEILLCNAPTDRHPDHGRAAKLTTDACFYAGLVKIETSIEGILQKPWRPKTIYHYIQDIMLQANVIVDISETFEQKINAIMSYSSQFYNPNSNEPVTPISSKQFLETISSKNTIWGRTIGVEYAEGFIATRTIGVNSLFQLL